mmetsp:Transcript_43498/g.98310  ORF Transcript_43498/g.98310 Transcript_43498/m.98310 type:complete len:322 (+) Transcript_43498:1-966(+)
MNDNDVDLIPLQPPKLSRSMSYLHRAKLSGDIWSSVDDAGDIHHPVSRPAKTQEGLCGPVEQTKALDPLEGVTYAPEPATLDYSSVEQSAGAADRSKPSVLNERRPKSKLYKSKRANHFEAGDFEAMMSRLPSSTLREAEEDHHIFQPTENLAGSGEDAITSGSARKGDWAQEVGRDDFDELMSHLPFETTEELAMDNALFANDMRIQPRGSPSVAYQDSSKKLASVGKQALSIALSQIEPLEVGVDSQRDNNLALVGKQTLNAAFTPQPVEELAALSSSPPNLERTLSPSNLARAVSASTTSSVPFLNPYSSVSPCKQNF